MKGLAHIGAWKAIRESGFEATGIVGTSIGALVGACLAGGRDWPELAPRALELQKQDIVLLNRWTLLLNGIRQKSVFHGERFREYIRETLPVRRFDELELPLSINAVDLETGRMEWFGAGGRTDMELSEAVYASCALPLFYPPAELDGRFYVDGAVKDSLPVQPAARQGADVIIAVDVAAGETKDPQDTLGKGLVAVHHRVFDIMAYDRRRTTLESWQAPPRLIYVRPELDGHSTFDFTRTKTFLEEGYRATRQRLAQLQPPLLGAEAVAAD